MATMIGVKDPMEGLCDRTGAPPSTSYDPPLVTAYVYSYGGHDGVNWSELQPSSTATLDSTVVADLRSKLDAAAAAGYTGGIKLRVLCGINSPAWLKSAVGTFKCDTTPTGGSASEADCPLWFLPAYQTYYDKLMELLAAQFDAHPALRDVAITADGLHYGEPYIRKINAALTTTGNTTRQNIWDAFYTARATAGFVDSEGRRYVGTSAPVSDYYHGAALAARDGSDWWKTDRHYGLQFADMASMRVAMATHNRWWVRTRSSLAVNPYQVIAKTTAGDVAGTVENTATDVARPYRSWTLASMLEARELMTQRLVLGNNSIRYTAARTPTGGDTYERANTSYGAGWGTASGGGTYTGTATDARVDSGYGQYRQNAVGDRRLRHTATAVGDSECLIGIAWSAHAAGAAHHVSTELCVQNISGTADGFYEIELEELTSGVVRIRWRKADSTVGVTTALPTAAAVNYTVTSAYPLGQTVWVRAQVESIADDTAALRARAWLDGDTEPAGWQIEITDTSPDLVNFAGHFGIRSNAGTGYTATSNVWSIASWAVSPIGTPTIAATVGGPSASGKYARIYQTQAEMGGPTYYQTASPSKLPNANWSDVMAWATADTTAVTSLGQHGQQASYVELPSSYDGRGGYSAWNTATLDTYRVAGEGNWPPASLPVTLGGYTAQERPVLQVLVGFRLDPNSPPGNRLTLDDATKGHLDDPNYPLGSINDWRDVTADVLQVSIRRRWDREQGVAEPGSCSLRLKNIDRRYDPDYALSPYAGGIWPNIPVKVQATFGGATVPLWQGYVDEWTCDYDMPIEGVVDVKATDLLRLAALARIPEDPEEPGGSDSSFDRVRRVVTAARMTITDFDTNVVVFNTNAGCGPTVTLAKSKFGESLLDHLRKVGEAERGYMAVHTDGRIHFGGRYQLATEPRSRYSQALFGDRSGETPYQSVAAEFTDRELLTSVTVKRAGSGDDIEEQTATNPAAEVQSGLRVQISKDISGVPYDRDTLAKGLAEFVLHLHEQPGLYVDEFKVRPRTGDGWAAVLARELGDRISIRRRPKRADGSLLSVDSHIVEIGHDIKPGSDWAVTVGCVPTRPTDDVCILDDPTRGVLGQARLG